MRVTQVIAFLGGLARTKYRSAGNTSASFHRPRKIQSIMLSEFSRESASALVLASSGPQYPRNRITFYFTGGSVSVSGANAPPMTGRALKLVDWMIVSYKSGNGVAEVLEFA